MYTPDQYSIQHKNPYHYETQNTTNWESKRQTTIPEEGLNHQQISYHEAERKRQQEQNGTNKACSKPTSTTSGTATSNSTGIKIFSSFAAFVIGGFYTLDFTEDWVAAFFAGSILALFITKAYGRVKMIGIGMIILLILAAL